MRNTVEEIFLKEFQATEWFSNSTTIIPLKSHLKSYRENLGDNRLFFVINRYQQIYYDWLWLKWLIWTSQLRDLHDSIYEIIICVYYFLILFLTNIYLSNNLANNVEYDGIWKSRKNKLWSIFSIILKHLTFYVQNFDNVYRVVFGFLTNNNNVHVLKYYRSSVHCKNIESVLRKYPVISINLLSIFYYKSSTPICHFNVCNCFRR